MTVRSIWAQTAPGVIGLDGTIPWRYPGDFRRFKRVTMGGAVIMGRLTWESIGKPLPGRTNIVVTSGELAPSLDVSWCRSIAIALRLAADNADHIWFIGGARIYEAAMAYVDEIDCVYVPDVVTAPHAVRAPAIDESVFEPGPMLPHEDEPTLMRRVWKRRAT